jgi:drug/metabolite transporter (DMT)-like permease
MNHESSLKPLLILAFGALCISFAPIFVKMIGLDILGPTAIAFWRTLFGAGILFLMAIVKGDSLKMPLPVLFFALLGGFVFFGDLFVWHRSILYSGAGLATILGNTQVFWMALIGVVLFQEKLKPMFLFAVVAAFVGVVLLVGVGSIEDFSTDYIKGITFGLMTGIFYAAYLTVLKKAGSGTKAVSFITLMAYTSLFCAMFAGVSMMMESDPYMPPDGYTYLVLVVLAVVAQALGWWVISWSLPKLRASQSGMVLLLQPTLAMVWGALFFAERLQLLQIFGALITLVAIYFGSARRTAVKRAEPK